MNVRLGQPYEVIINNMIKKGYAENKTEILRQALLSYEREVSEEEVALVHLGTDYEMGLIKSGKVKTLPLEKIKEKYKMR